MSDVTHLPPETAYVRNSPSQPRPATRPPGVTDRQLECLYWVEQGKSATDIGAILDISPRTVEGHLIKVCGHFQVRTRFQAVLHARDLGLLKRARP